MNPAQILGVALVVAAFFLWGHYESRRADRMEEERDIFIDLLVADAHEKAEAE